MSGPVACAVKALLLQVITFSVVLLVVEWSFRDRR